MRWERGESLGVGEGVVDRSVMGEFLSGWVEFQDGGLEVCIDIQSE